MSTSMTHPHGQLGVQAQLEGKNTIRDICTTALTLLALFTLFILFKLLFTV